MSVGDLDAAWESVPSSPRVDDVDPIEQLKRLFRGAVAANPSLWRSVTLDDAVVALDELARQRLTPTSPIPLEAVKKRLVKMHAPRTALNESFLAFAEEAKAIGVAVSCPPRWPPSPNSRRSRC